MAERFPSTVFSLKTIILFGAKATSLQILLSEKEMLYMNSSKIFTIRMEIKGCIFFALLIMIYSCKKDSENSLLHYYEVGSKTNTADWRDSSFIVATANASLISEIEAQLSLSVSERKIVTGQLISGSGGYNKNASHQFKWHFKEDDWELTEISAEIFDGRPYSDVDTDTGYWLNTVKRFAPWSSYVKREIAGQ